ncbi:LOW QUALITY PROTEIN: hypothetical protein PHMEG_00032059 [Phytophthora megakarya]|uniref:Retrotransposon gag domain-containing protein n=1 Tax=Phytophthora megakarya TaxID=4795 RepID=A0A225UWL1_9STRA|nr:LOW QUALITY PROTEIN: hypothetical protein PHMEG_00032059 [Phytophthora megakarya]
MVRVPGSSGDSQGFHRESDEDATKIKLEPGIEASAEGSARKQLKAPDSDTEDRGDQPWANEDLAQTFYKKGLFACLLDEPVVKTLSPMLIGELQGPTLEPAETPRQLEAATQLLRMLKDAGIIPGAFNASELFDLEAPVIQRSTRTLYETGTAGRVSHTTGDSQADIDSEPRISDRYASATSEAESDSSVDLQQMPLGMSGAEMLREHQANTKPDRSPHEPTPIVTPAVTSRSPEQMQTFFNADMNRYLKEKQTEGSTPTAGRHTTNNQDVKMESVKSHHDSHGEQPEHRHTSTSSDRIRKSGLCTLDDDATYTSVGDIGVEYSGKDHDEDRARSWQGKEKSAFVRDQSPDSEKCLVLTDLLTGPARNRYRQLSRSMRSSWKRLFEAFQTQYCGQGVSVARQYYHAKKRSDKSPLEYLHRLNVTGLRAKLQVKDGPLATRHEHVEYFIETLDDRELADQLALLRLTDTEDLKETLRARQRANIPEKLPPLRIREARQPGLL